MIYFSPPVCHCPRLASSPFTLFLLLLKTLASVADSTLRWELFTLHPFLFLFSSRYWHPVFSFSHCEFSLLLRLLSQSQAEDRSHLIYFSPPVCHCPRLASSPFTLFLLLLKTLASVADSTLRWELFTLHPFLFLFSSRYWHPVFSFSHCEFSLLLRLLSQSQAEDRSHLIYFSPPVCHCPRLASSPFTLFLLLLKTLASVADSTLRWELFTLHPFLFLFSSRYWHPVFSFSHCEFSLLLRLLSQSQAEDRSHLIYFSPPVCHCPRLASSPFTLFLLLLKTLASVADSTLRWELFTLHPFLFLFSSRYWHPVFSFSHCEFSLLLRLLSQSQAEDRSHLIYFSPPVCHCPRLASSPFTLFLLLLKTLASVADSTLRWELFTLHPFLFLFSSRYWHPVFSFSHCEFSLLLRLLSQSQAEDRSHLIYFSPPVCHCPRLASSPFTLFLLLLKTLASVADSTLRWELFTLHPFLFLFSSRYWHPVFSFSHCEFSLLLRLLSQSQAEDRSHLIYFSPPVCHCPRLASSPFTLFLLLLKTLASVADSTLRWELFTLHPFLFLFSSRYWHPVFSFSHCEFSLLLRLLSQSQAEDRSHLIPWPSPLPESISLD